MDKSIFNFKIQYKDGKVIDLHEDKNLWVSSFRILSPSPDHVTEKIDGRHGSLLLETTLQERKIKASFTIEAVDAIDFDLFRDELFKIFNPLKKFYIIRDLQPRKRMEVSVSSEFDIDYLTLEDGEFSVDFVINSVFLESIGTTLDPLVTTYDRWQVGQGLIGEDTKYIHSTNSFRIYNSGDVPVDPCVVPLNIKFKGTSNSLSIINETTGDVWKYNGITNVSDTIELKGIRSLKNGLSIFKDTNKKLISIDSGWNDFRITGATSPFEISFDFRFYYF